VWHATGDRTQQADGAVDTGNRTRSRLQGKTFLIQFVSRDFEAVIPGLDAQRIELSFTAGAQNGAFPAFHRDI